MKLLTNVVLSVFVCLLCVTALLAQQATAPAKKIYKNIQVEKFTVKEGVEFTAENIAKISQNMVRALVKTKRFNQVSLVGADAASSTTAVATADTADLPTLKLSGEIIMYNKGSQGARYLLGPFGGQKYATRVIAMVKFIDVKTGETVLEQTADGIVAGGFFGGDKDGANDGLSGEVVKIVKNNFSEKSK